MQTVQESIEIVAPVEMVFEFVADFRNALQWMYGFDQFELLTETARGKGAKVRAAGHIHGFSVATELEITEFVPNSKLVSVSSSGIESVSAWIFKPTPRGTRVTFVGHYRLPHGIPAGIIGGLWLRRELADHAWKSLKRLKRAVETNLATRTPQSEEDD